MENQTVDGPGLRQVLENLPGTIRRAVVDDDQLDLQGHGPNSPDDLLHRLSLVVHGHDDGESPVRVHEDARPAIR